MKIYNSKVKNSQISDIQNLKDLKIARKICKKIIPAEPPIM